MSGWRIVPVDMTPEMIESADGWTLPEDTWEYALKVAPEPDWEALAGIVLNDDVYDQYATGGEIRRLAAALKATFGSKP